MLESSTAPTRANSRASRQAAAAVSPRSRSACSASSTAVTARDPRPQHHADQAAPFERDAQGLGAQGRLGDR